MDYLRGLLGITVFLSIAYLCSNNRKHINWRLVATGVTLQIIFGVLVLEVPTVKSGFMVIGEKFAQFINYTQAGTKFLFGEQLYNAGGSTGFIFAFQVLPTIIFFSTVSAGLYYLGVLQKIVFGIAWVMSKTMHLSGAESLSAAGNIFLGQTEAPLLVRPFIKKMTISEINCLMTGGMATLAGGVLAYYITLLGGNDLQKQAEFAAYLLSASVMNAPGAIVMSKMLFPETEAIEVKLEVSKESLGVNLIDAMSIGAGDGLKLALNVGGMLLAFIAVVALLNGMLGWIGDIGAEKEGMGRINQSIKEYTNGLFTKLSLEYILGLVGQPVAWLMGVDWKDTLVVGSLIGQKTALNEAIAYTKLAEFKAIGDAAISQKAILISTFALCGFSNFSSIAIQIGGIGGMAPERQGDLSRLGMRALLGASLACFMTAAIAGALSSL